jgi:hypothetical protein
MAQQINIKRLISAGFRLGQIGFKDSNGFQGGISGATAQGSVSSMYTWAGVKTAQVQIPESNSVTVTGDDGVLGTFDFDSDSPRTFNMTLGELDLNVASKGQNTNIYTVGNYYDMMLGDPIGAGLNDAVLLLTAEGKIQDTGKEGSGWYHLMFPNVTVKYLGNNLEYQSPTDQNFKVTINPFTRTPWGLDLSASNFGAEKGHYLFWGSQKRMTLNTYRYNGSDTTFLLSRVPYTDSNNIIRVAGWRSNPNGVHGIDINSELSVVAATKTVTISGVSNLNAGDYIETLLEYN